MDPKGKSKDVDVPQINEFISNVGTGSASVIDSKGIYYYSPHWYAINRVDLKGQSILPSVGVNIETIMKYGGVHTLLKR